MASDVVVDTNIFLHAHDPRQETQAACCKIISILHASEVMLCLDEGFHYSPAQNKSKIMSEYLELISHGSLGFALLAELAQSQRLKSLPSKVDARSRKIIIQNVSDSTDRCFVKIAKNSACRIFISHDYAAMPTKSRRILRSSLDINVVDAVAGESLLKP